MAKPEVLLVKELHDRTGAGILDCKKALIKAEYDMDKAIRILRERGAEIAHKKSGRVASEGIIAIVSNESGIALAEFNSETDFVAQNPLFTETAQILTHAIAANKPGSIESALEVVHDELKISDHIINLTAKIGEKIELRRFNHLPKNHNYSQSIYLHTNKKIATLIQLNKPGYEELAYDFAMHVTAMSPKFISREHVNEEFLRNETELIKKIIDNENSKSDKPKPDFILEKMLQGRVEKSLANVVFEEQQFVKDSSKKIKDILKEKGLVVLEMIRLEVGEGIEKVTVSFRDEVMKQVKN